MSKRVGIIGSTTPTASWRDDELQAFERDFLSAGVIQGIGGAMAVSQHGGGNMSVDVAAGRALIQITNTNLTPNKTYKVYFDSDTDTSAVTTVNIAAADPTNPRIDIVCAKVDVSQNPDASAGNIASIIVVTGTPAGSPSAPATPANCLLLAQVAVAAGAASIVNANITDKRTYVTSNSGVLADIARQGLVNNLATVGGSANAITLTLNPVPSSYAAPMVIWFVATASNTGAVTINVNGLGSKTLVRLNGATALVAGDIASGQLVCIAYDGTQFQMLTPSANAPTSANYEKVLSVMTSSTSSIGATSVSELAISSGVSIPSTIWGVGTVLRITIAGTQTWGAGSLTFRLRMGGISGAVLGHWVMTPVATGENWTLSAIIVCRATGSSGSLVCTGLFQMGDAQASSHVNIGSGDQSGNTAIPQTVNLTGALTLQPTLQFGSSNGTNGLVMVNFVVEQLSTTPS